MKRCVPLFGWCLLVIALPAQNLLENASFERHPEQLGRVPHGWANAGPVSESPPDVHTNTSNYFGVQHLAAEGEAYLGMVARDNYTFEAVSQRIPGGLRAGVTYRLRLWVSHSPTLASTSRQTGRPARYNNPIPFDVYVAEKANGGKFELVARSEPIDHADWREYTLEFTPTRDWKFLRLGAGMNTLYARPVCGNVLIDAVELTVLATAAQ